MPFSLPPAHRDGHGAAPVGDWYARPEAREWRCAPPPHGVLAFHARLPGYAPTPLVEIPELAAELGVGRLLVKDESARLGMPAFKMLGASWAVASVVAAHQGPGAPPGPATPLVTATDGNHGRAVARMAATFGLPSHVFVPAVMSAATRAAILAEGAEVTVVDGSYDDAVRAAANAPGTLIQDTAWPGYEHVPALIVEGYETMTAEIDGQLGGDVLDLVAVPVGVGSLAQAVVRHYRSGARRPAVLAVEPDSAACVLASLRAGVLTSVPTGETVMAGLNCGTPSSLAWPFLQHGLDAAVAVPDDAASAAVADLACFGIDSGPSGAATLAGVRAALGSGSRRRDLGVVETSIVVLLSTEATGSRAP